MSVAAAAAVAVAGAQGRSMFRPHGHDDDYGQDDTNKTNSSSPFYHLHHSLSHHQQPAYPFSSPQDWGRDRDRDRGRLGQDHHSTQQFADRDTPMRTQSQARQSQLLTSPRQPSQHNTNNHSEYADYDYHHDPRHITINRHHYSDPRLSSSSSSSSSSPENYLASQLNYTLHPPPPPYTRLPPSQQQQQQQQQQQHYHHREGEGREADRDELEPFKTFLRDRFPTATTSIDTDGASAISPRSLGGEGTGGGDVSEVTCPDVPVAILMELIKKKVSE